VAATQLAGCDTLDSADRHHGHVFEARRTVANLSA
jgi:hypothetical protein